MAEEDLGWCHLRFGDALCDRSDSPPALTQPGAPFCTANVDEKPTALEGSPAQQIKPSTSTQPRYRQSNMLCAHKLGSFFL